MGHRREASSLGKRKEGKKLALLSSRTKRTRQEYNS